MAIYDTVANIVSDVAIEVGLDAPANVYSSTDNNIIQMRTLLKVVGRGLILKNSWLQQRKEYSFVTTAATSYNLPADFQSMIDQTGWNRSSRLPVHPASPQEWQYLKAHQVGNAWTVNFKPKSQTIEVWPQPPPSGNTIAFEYLSQYWVRATASSSPDKDSPTANTDVIHIDWQLITRALKFHFLRAKGFDSSGAENDYIDAFEDVKSANINASPVLSLNMKYKDDVGEGCDTGFAVGGTGSGFEGGLY